MRKNAWKKWHFRFRKQSKVDYKFYIRKRFNIYRVRMKKIYRVYKRVSNVRLKSDEKTWLCEFNTHRFVYFEKMYYLRLIYNTVRVGWNDIEYDTKISLIYATSGRTRVTNKKKQHECLHRVAHRSIFVLLLHAWHRRLWLCRETNRGELVNNNKRSLKGTHWARDLCDISWNDILRTAARLASSTFRCNSSRSLFRFFFLVLTWTIFIFERFSFRPEAGPLACTALPITSLDHFPESTYTHFESQRFYSES